MTTVRSRLLMALLLVAIPSSAQKESSDDEAIIDGNITALNIEEVQYPPLARAARIQGVVVIRAKLDSQGTVVSSSAISGHPLLIKDCLPNALKWRFKPNSLNQVVIVYNFRIDNGLCYAPYAPCSSQFAFQQPNFATISAGPFPVNP